MSNSSELNKFVENDKTIEDTFGQFKFYSTQKDTQGVNKVGDLETFYGSKFNKDRQLELLSN